MLKNIKLNSEEYENIIDEMLNVLAKESEQKIPASLSYKTKRELLNTIISIHLSGDLGDDFFIMQDKLLSYENMDKKVLEIEELRFSKNIAAHYGDVECLNVDVIAALINMPTFDYTYFSNDVSLEKKLVSLSGLKLREDLTKGIKLYQESSSNCYVCKGYNLRAEYVFFSKLPKVKGLPIDDDIKKLKDCYIDCLLKAKEMKSKSIAFCIDFEFEKYIDESLIEIIIEEIKLFFKKSHYKIKIIINTFSQGLNDLFKKKLKIK